MSPRLLPFVIALACAVFPIRAASPTPPPVVPSDAPLEPGVVACGNLIYAGGRSSVCFASAFLQTVKRETNIQVEKQFRGVQLDSDRLFDLPFCILSGEEAFTLSERERAQLRRYLLSGGFILASPSCSNAAWDRSFRTELALALPEHQLVALPMSHPIFSVVKNVDSLVCKNGNTAVLEALEINGRVVLIHSREGLNDVAAAIGCCCCGGNEIKSAALVNVNILTYALLY